MLLRRYPAGPADSSQTLQQEAWLNWAGQKQRQMATWNCHILTDSLWDPQGSGGFQEKGALSSSRSYKI